jgi:uncharacterized protein involved in exopolysaccharide biosynthesis
VKKTYQKPTSVTLRPTLRKGDTTMRGLLVAIALLLGASGVVVGSERVLSGPEVTPAYGVLVLRKATVESELADLSERFTNEHPSLEAKRFELRAITVEMDKMRQLEESQADKLSRTFGDLVLSKIALKVQLNDLQGRLTWQHPDVTKKRVELAALEREIEKLLL